MSRAALERAQLAVGLLIALAVVIGGLLAVRANEPHARAAAQLRHELRENAQFPAGDGR